MSIPINSVTVMVAAAVCAYLGLWRAASIRQPDYGWDVHPDGCIVALVSVAVFLVSLGFFLSDVL